ncbi:MAG: 4-(cytidine 5'-diphospho)-2-C-methyl-D-erythritol kinase [Cyanobacteria bacterium SZAS LIN-3]|nr:4-(cytidine 5'-diphospho)-2-C-methyl-D-erythritol kinase [Cyanobacteria bacterium SZAS LIN-3]
MTDCTTITVNSPAKVNLTFEVLGLLPDGYHEVRTLMQSVSLFDELTFDIKPAREPSLTISLQKGSNALAAQPGSPDGQFPLGEGNLIARALRLFLSSIERPRVLKVDVAVLKNVPIGAGLAGGSGNAAATLVALNQYFGGPLDGQELTALAAKLGADVPFCLKGGRLLGLGRGDQLTAIDEGGGAVNEEISEDEIGGDDTLHFVLAKARHLSLATPWVYQAWDEKAAARELMSLEEKVKDRGIDALPCDYAIANLQKHNLKEALRVFGNDFEQVVFPHYKQLKEIKTRFIASGALASHMTGSGPTIYAVAESAEHARELMSEFRRREAADTSLVCATKFDQVDLYAVHSTEGGAMVVQVEKK